MNPCARRPVEGLRTGAPGKAGVSVFTVRGVAFAGSRNTRCDRPATRSIPPTAVTPDGEALPAFQDTRVGAGNTRCPSGQPGTVAPPRFPLAATAAGPVVPGTARQARAASAPEARDTAPRAAEAAVSPRVAPSQPARG